MDNVQPTSSKSPFIVQRVKRTIAEGRDVIGNKQRAWIQIYISWNQTECRPISQLGPGEILLHVCKAFFPFTELVTCSNDGSLVSLVVTMSHVCYQLGDAGY